MARTVQVSLPSEETKKILSGIKELDGLISLRIQKDGSTKPDGDVLSFELTNPCVSDFLSLMERHDLLRNENISITTNQIDSIISPAHSEQILSESHETSWEEALKGLLHDSNMTLNSSILMFIAGVIAVIGISMDSLHVVIGAMLIAPGFEPISRMAMGVVAMHNDWKNGAKDIFLGYFLLISGSLVGAIILKLMSKDIFGDSSSYIADGALVEYWSSITVVSLITSVFAAAAGGLVVLSNKTILTAGVMVALALIPTGSLIGIGIVAGDYELAGMGAIRMLLEIVIVAAVSGAVFLWKKSTTQKREMNV